MPNTATPPVLGEVTRRQAFTSGPVLKAAELQPATYATYRKLRTDPTVAIARELAVSTIVAAQWSVEADRDIDEEIVEFVRAQFLPVRQALVDAVVRFGDIDFGYMGFEKVFDQDPEGRTRIRKFKGLLHDLTDILVDDRGRFAGFSQPRDRTVVPLAKALLIPFRVEGANWLGEPRMENVRLSLKWWNDANDGAARYDKKLAGSHLKVGFPPGTSKDEFGTDRPNAEIAARIAANFQSSGSVCFQRDLSAFTDKFQIAPEAMGWDIDLMESAGGQQMAFIDRLRYLDSLKCRGILIPERSVTEGQMGTLAEAEAHADLGMIMAELAHAYLTSLVNWHAVDQVLAINWGDSMRGKVRLLPAPIRDAKKQFIRELYRSFLANPQGFLEEYGALDTDAIRDELELPRRDEATPEGEETPVVALPGMDTGDPKGAAVAEIYADGLPAQPAAESVQATALNGAQIASLMEVCQLVVQKELPPAAAKELIKISFPTITESQVQKLIASLATAEKPATAVVV